MWQWLLFNSFPTLLIGSRCAWSTYYRWSSRCDESQYSKHTFRSVDSNKAENHELRVRVIDERDALEFPATVRAHNICRCRRSYLTTTDTFIQQISCLRCAVSFGEWSSRDIFGSSGKRVRDASIIIIGYVLMESNYSITVLYRLDLNLIPSTHPLPYCRLVYGPTFALVSILY